jgi:hypothetical protein
MRSGDFFVTLTYPQASSCTILPMSHTSRVLNPCESKVAKFYQDLDERFGEVLSLKGLGTSPKRFFVFSGGSLRDARALRFQFPERPCMVYSHPRISQGIPHSGESKRGSLNCPYQISQFVRQKGEKRQEHIEVSAYHLSFRFFRKKEGGRGEPPRETENIF